MNPHKTNDDEMKCIDCVFWDQSNKSFDQPRPCRRRAPVVGPEGYWPMTMREEWCADFQRKGTLGPLINDLPRNSGK